VTNGRFPEGSVRANKGEEIQDDIGGDLEFVAAVIAGSVHTASGLLAITLRYAYARRSFRPRAS